MLNDDSMKDLYQGRLDENLEEFSFENIKGTYDHLNSSKKEATLEVLEGNEGVITDHKTELNY